MIKQVVKQDPTRRYTIARKNAEEMNGTYDAGARTWTIVRKEAVPTTTLKSYGLLEVRREVVE